MPESLNLVINEIVYQVSEVLISSARFLLQGNIPSMGDHTSNTVGVVGGPMSHLLEQNYLILNQYKQNMQQYKVNENTSLLVQFRDNILAILNQMSCMTGLMQHMPDLPVRLNEDLANSFLPKATNGLYGRSGQPVLSSKPICMDFLLQMPRGAAQYSCGPAQVSRFPFWHTVLQLKKFATYLMLNATRQSTCLRPIHRCTQYQNPDKSAPAWSLVRRRCYGSRQRLVRNIKKSKHLHVSVSICTFRENAIPLLREGSPDVQA